MAGWAVPAERGPRAAPETSVPAPEPATTATCVSGWTRSHRTFVRAAASSTSTRSSRSAPTPTGTARSSAWTWPPPRTALAGLPTLPDRPRPVRRPTQRASSSLCFVLRSVAAELGGRPGARLCRKLSVPEGRSGSSDICMFRPCPTDPPACSAWTSSPSAAVVATERSSSTSKPISSSTSCQIEVPRRWPLGSVTMPVPRSCAGTGRAPTPVPSRTPPLAPLRWLIAGTCCATCLSQANGSATNTAPACGNTLNNGGRLNRGSSPWSSRRPR